VTYLSGVTRPALVLRVLGAAALGVSSYVHLHLADRYPYPGTITGTQLFYAQGIVAAVLGLALLLTGHRLVWIAAAALGVASFAAVMLYRYTDLGAIGPLPDMNDMTWQPSPDKLLSAVVEALLPLLWLADELRRRAQVRPSYGQRSEAAAS
jgi:hypothetical protein